MKLTWKWLLEHLETEAGIDQVVETLPKLGLEVASVIDIAKDLREFVSVEVLEVNKHPNADKLNVCIVFDGNKHFKVVCGAHNVKVGMIGVFAYVGTFIPGLNFTLKSGNIRGEQSDGMLCSEKELTISDKHEGIIELPKSTKNGLSVVDVLELNDPIIEIEITPNRGDCLGVRGIARDLAASGIGTLKELKIKEIEGDFESLINWKIDLNKDENFLCPKIFGRSFTDLTNKASPSWMQKRLLAVDQRPISSLVDITNYIMIDLGRPLHAYDIKKIEGKNLTVKKSKKGDKFNALNGKIYDLNNEMLVISDSHGIDDLAGIMGGERTSVNLNTTEIFLEAAIFSPSSIAQTGRTLNINSDARYRFERGLDYNSPELVMHYAALMIQKICGGKVSKIVSLQNKNENKKIIFNPEIILKLSGVIIENNKSLKILEKLGFNVLVDNNNWNIIVPSWRSDIDGVADIVEEIIRVNGYSSIPTIMLSRKNYIAKPAMNSKHRQSFFATRILATRGYNEVITFSFLNKVMAHQFNGGQNSLSLVNPISSELTDMRPSILPNLIQAAQKNINKGIDNISLCETGPVFKGDSPNEQLNSISGIRIGNKYIRDWKKTSEKFDFYDIKSDVLETLYSIGSPSNSLKIFTDAPNYFHPGRSATFKIGINIIANFGEIHPEITEFYGLKSSVFGFEIFPDKIPIPKNNKTARPMLKTASLQAVTREFAFIVDNLLESEKVIQAAKSADKKLITDIMIYDIYEGKNIPEGKKSIAIKVTIQPNLESLTDKDLEQISSNIIEVIKTKLSGTLREV
jgi:phenylalanyl-tRNA synthetase beta chain|tara:strand:- start:575 stop:2977 length:2403 start_codon:yes stop_codon:yes gene_type:complete